ncbi:MAG: hypothetical protein KDA93_15725 [Planctomycetaceae bacterium]|nr:hypothetical protein [Planctomycetaceae bacterium]
MFDVRLYQEESSTRLVALTLLALSGLISGCSDSQSQSNEVTPVARSQPASLSTPLTDTEIETFLNVAASMPDGELPKFMPLSKSTIDDRLPPETLINAYRLEYRSMFDATGQAIRWRRDSDFIRLLSALQTDPEEFASLMTRIGCAVASSTVMSQLNLEDASAKATEQLTRLCSQITALDEFAATNQVNPIAVNQRRQPLVDQLKSLVALLEFSRILSAVPEESRTVIDRHREQILAHLPSRGDLEMFERTLDAPAVIVPASHEAPAVR